MTEGRRRFRETDTCNLRKKLFGGGWLEGNPLKLRAPKRNENAGFKNKLTATLLAPPGYPINKEYVFILTLIRY